MGARTKQTFLPLLIWRGNKTALEETVLEAGELLSLARSITRRKRKHKL